MGAGTGTFSVGLWLNGRVLNSEANAGARWSVTDRGSPPAIRPLNIHA